MMITKEDVYGDFVYDPFEYWHRLYEQYRPIIVIGDRTVNKYEVAIQICRYFDKNFTIDRDIYYDFDEDCFGDEEERAIMFPSFRMDWAFPSSKMIKMNKILEKMLDFRRTNKQYYCFVSSGELKNFSNYLLSQVSDVVFVRKILKDYIICEHYYFHHPDLLSKYARLPYIDFEDREERKEFFERLRRNMFIFPTKYPRLDGVTRRRFEEHRKGMMDRLIDIDDK